MDIFIIVLLVVFIAALIYCGTLLKKLLSIDEEADYRETFDELLTWADIFVRAVRDSKKAASGPEKRELAIKYIKEVCANLDLQLSDAQLENIIRAAYIDMTDEIFQDEITVENEIEIDLDEDGEADEAGPEGDAEGDEPDGDPEEVSTDGE